METKLKRILPHDNVNISILGQNFPCEHLFWCVPAFAELTAEKIVHVLVDPRALLARTLMPWDTCGAADHLLRQSTPSWLAKIIE